MPTPADLAPVLLDKTGILLSVVLASLENSIDAFADTCPSLVDGILGVALNYDFMPSVGPPLAAAICPTVKVR